MEIINNTSIQISLTLIIIAIAFYKELKVYKIFSLTGLGLSVTIIYIFILVCALDIGFKDIVELRSVEKDGLVNLGIFLGGVFSPVAFLWLIIGYLMQNKELKQSREEYIKSSLIAERSLELKRIDSNRNLKGKIPLIHFEQIEIPANHPETVIKISGKSTTKDIFNFRLVSSKNDCQVSKTIDSINKSSSFTLETLISIDTDSPVGDLYQYVDRTTDFLKDNNIKRFDVEGLILEFTTDEQIKVRQEVEIGVFLHDKTEPPLFDGKNQPERVVRVAEIKIDRFQEPWTLE